VDYSEIRKINVNKHTEKKGGFTYLSWAWAVDEMLKLDQEADWWFDMFGPGDERRPYSIIGGSAMVFCHVKMFNRTRVAQMPVLDYRNKSIPLEEIDSFNVNTAMMRALAKGISMHGIGLYIYAGEDLPQSDIRPLSGAGEGLDQYTKDAINSSATEIGAMFVSGDIEGAFERYAIIKEGGVDETNFLWSLLDSKCRTAIKKFGKEKN